MEFCYGSGEVGEEVGGGVGGGGGCGRGVVEGGIAHGEVEPWDSEEGEGEEWSGGVCGDEVNSGVEGVEG